jgi:phosphorylated CTD-interacting factor 1
METVKESVEGICLKIYHLSADYAKKIKETHSEVLKENGISGTWISCAFCITC